MMEPRQLSRRVDGSTVSHAGGEQPVRDDHGVSCASPTITEQRIDSGGRLRGRFSALALFQTIACDAVHEFLLANSEQQLSIPVSLHNTACQVVELQVLLIYVHPLRYYAAGNHGTSTTAVFLTLAVAQH